jgi:apolipoprotein N-acyltransferase
MTEAMMETTTMRRRPWLLLAAGAALIVLANLRWQVGALAWLAPLPLLAYLRASDGRRARVAFSLALLGAWILATLKIVTPPMPSLLAVAFGLPVGLFHLAPYLAWDRLRRRQPAWRAALAFAAMAVVCEWAQWRLTPLASWGAAAYTQLGDLPLLQLASLFGPSGIGLLLYWLPAAAEAAIAARGRDGTVRALAVAVAAVAGAHAFGAARLAAHDDGASVRVAAVGTDATVAGLPLPDAARRRRDDDALFARSAAAARAGARVVVWTEAATVVPVDEEAALVERGRALARAEQIELVLAYIVPVQLAPLRLDNKYQWIRPDGSVDHVYRKHQPVPGEPSLRGTGAPGVVATAAGRASGAICYDYDFPWLARAQAQLGVDLVALPSSDWRGIAPLHTEMASLRAIEGGFSLVRSARFGRSAIYDRFGRARGELDDGAGERVLIASLPRHGAPTLYARTGDLLVWLCMIFILLTGAASRSRSADRPA